MKSLLRAILTGAVIVAEWHRASPGYPPQRRCALSHPFPEGNKGNAEQIHDQVPFGLCGHP
jgi:hypothetical protein